MSYTPLPGDPCSAGYAPFPEMWFSPFPEECLDAGEPLPPTPDNYDDFQWGNLAQALSEDKSWMVTPPYQISELIIIQAMAWIVDTYLYQVNHTVYSDSDAEDPEEVLTEENTLWAGLGSGSYVERHNFYSSNDHWGWRNPRSYVSLWVAYGEYRHNFEYTHTVVWDSYYQQWKHTYTATWDRYYVHYEWHNFARGGDFNILAPTPSQSLSAGSILFQIEQTKTNELVESVSCQVLGPEFHTFDLSSTAGDEEVWEASQTLTYNGTYTATFTTEYLWFAVVKSVQFSITDGTDPPEGISGNITTIAALMLLMGLGMISGNAAPIREPHKR